MKTSDANWLINWSHSQCIQKIHS